MRTILSIVGKYKMRTIQILCSFLENIVVLGTAHPFKFSDTIKKATGKNLEAPSHLKMDVDKKEKFDIIENSSSQVKNYILNKIK